MNLRRHNWRRESGQVVLLTALMLPVLAGLGALAVDLSYLYGQRQATQMAADAGAQAGAIAIANDVANGHSSQAATDGTTDATAYVNRNGFNSGNSTVQVNIPPQSPPATGTYSSNDVQVVITLHRNPILAGILGITGLTSTVQAVATAKTPLGSHGIMWVLDHTAPNSLSATGNGCISAGGQVYVNSNAGTAISPGSQGCNHVGTSFFSSDTISVVGGFTSGCCSPTPTTMPGPVPDPLSGVGMPYYSNGNWYSGDGTQLQTQTTPTGSGTVTFNPGVYVGGITLSSSTTYVMNPGIYIMDGGGFNVSGGPNITGNGIFIYNSSSTSPSSCGTVNIAGNAAETFSSPTSGLYQGILVAQDRSCPTTVTLTGTGNLATDGTFYAPDAHLQLGGTSAQAGTQAFLIADTVGLNGTANIALSKPDAAHTPNAVDATLAE